MTGRLIQSDLSLQHSTEYRAIRAAGGLWHSAAPTIRACEVIAEAKARGVRALLIYRGVELLARELPDLEFLVVTGGEPEAEWIQPLARLRSLSLDGSWRGKLDLAALPHLEWLSVAEAEPRTLDAFRQGHPSLWNLRIGRYPAADLRPLENLRLRRLSIGHSSRFVSLAGASALAPSLRSLSLWYLPRLGSLDGIEALSGLEYLELDSVRQVTRLDFVRSLPGLRMLNVFGLKNVATLAPLAGHPGLEFVFFGRTADLDLEPLERVPKLRMILTGQYRWNRDPRSFPHLSYVPEDDPTVVELRRLQDV